jgi:hypothetical protein
MTRTPYHSISGFWDTYKQYTTTRLFFFKAEPVSSKLRTHVQKELDRGAESHSQFQIFPFLCATLYLNAEVVTKILLVEQITHMFSYFRFPESRLNKVCNYNRAALNLLNASGHYKHPELNRRSVWLWSAQQADSKQCCLHIICSFDLSLVWTWRPAKPSSSLCYPTHSTSITRRRCHNGLMYTDAVYFFRYERSAPSC